MSVQPVDPPEIKWRHITALALALCVDKTEWVLEFKSFPIWHKLKRKNRTTCGYTVDDTPPVHTMTVIDPPPEEFQCIVCQFGLPYLVEVEGKDQTQTPAPTTTPTKPPSGNPDGDYTPSPPTMALQVPIAMAA